MTGMRGLSVFISDVRNCQNKEAERLRVDKELGNIRTCFKNEKVRGFSFSSLTLYVDMTLSPFFLIYLYSQLSGNSVYVLY